jgi:hypothetical protein
MSQFQDKKNSEPLLAQLFQKKRIATKELTLYILNRSTGSFIEMKFFFHQVEAHVIPYNWHRVHSGWDTSTLFNDAYTNVHWGGHWGVKG